MKRSQKRSPRSHSFASRGYRPITLWMSPQVRRALMARKEERRTDASLIVERALRRALAITS